MTPAVAGQEFTMAKGTTTGALPGHVGDVAQPGARSCSWTMTSSCASSCRSFSTAGIFGSRRRMTAPGALACPLRRA